MKAVSRTGDRSSGKQAPVWLRGPREPAGAYAAFVVYRDQPPPRSLYRLSEVLDLDVQSLHGWSEKWNWVQRAAAFAAHADSASVGGASEDELIRRRREAAEQLYAIGRDLLVAGHCRLTGASDDKGNLVVQGLHPDELNASEVARFLDLGTRLVRTSTGLPSDLSGSMTVSLDSLERILGSFIELAEKRMPREEHEALVRDCYAMVREKLGSV